MAESTLNKLGIAREQLDEAIRQFLEKRSCVCALTLSGAAEEILGRAVELRGGVSVLMQMVRDHTMIHKAFTREELNPKQSRWRHNFAKNALKHLNDLADESITLDLEHEAIDMIGRATGNLFLLELPISEEVRQFEAWFLENCVGV